MTPATPRELSKLTRTQQLAYQQAVERANKYNAEGKALLVSLALAQGNRARLPQDYLQRMNDLIYQTATAALEQEDIAQCYLDGLLDD